MPWRFQEKRLFSNLRLHLNETQHSSDITSKVRIKNFTSDIMRGDVNKIKGALCRQKKFEKRLIAPKKIIGGSFALKFRWPNLALVVLVVSVKGGLFSVRSVVSVKYDNRGQCKSRAFFAPQKAPTKKISR